MQIIESSSLNAANGTPVRVIAVSGRIDQSSADTFDKALKPFLDTCRSDEPPLIIDFSGVDYISSVGLRVLMLASRQVKTQSGRIGIAALTPVVAEVFQISRFNLVFQVFATQEAAAAALSA